jgi:hypothetical protein
MSETRAETKSAVSVILTFCVNKIRYHTCTECNFLFLLKTRLETTSAVSVILLELFELFCLSGYDIFRDNCTQCDLVT